MKHFYTCLFLLVATASQAQDNRLFPKVDRSLIASRVWLELSNGPSLTTGGLFAAGPGLSAVWITKNARVLKVKFAYHESLGLFVNFPQRAGELSLMTGVISPLEHATFEVYYGLGVIGGQRHGERQEGSPSRYSFDSTMEFEKVKFITVGIPADLRIQWKVFGLGVDANLNIHSPYFGLKIFTRIRIKKEVTTDF
jgi:hypothetical protein